LADKHKQGGRHGVYATWVGLDFRFGLRLFRHCKVQMKSTQIVATCPKFVSVSASTCLVAVPDFWASSRASILIIQSSWPNRPVREPGSY